MYSISEGYLLCHKHLNTGIVPLVGFEPETNQIKSIWEKKSKQHETFCDQECIALPKDNYFGIRISTLVLFLWWDLNQEL